MLVRLNSADWNICHIVLVGVFLAQMRMCKSLGSLVQNRNFPYGGLRARHAGNRLFSFSVSSELLLNDSLAMRRQQRELKPGKI